MSVVRPLLEGEAPGANVGWFNVAHGIDVVAQAVYENEPCYYLGEFNLPSKSGKSKSRYQMLRVVRDDRLVTAYVYLGPARKFDAAQFQMIGGYTSNGRGYAVHTVAELRDGADELRSAPPPSVVASDMQGQFIEQIDQIARMRKGKSTYGSGGFIQRDY